MSTKKARVWNRLERTQTRDSQAPRALRKGAATSHFFPLPPNTQAPLTTWRSRHSFFRSYRTNLPTSLWNFFPWFPLQSMQAHLMRTRVQRTEKEETTKSLFHSTKFSWNIIGIKIERKAAVQFLGRFTWVSEQLNSSEWMKKRGKNSKSGSESFHLPHTDPPSLLDPDLLLSNSFWLLLNQALKRKENSSSIRCCRL